MRNDFSRPDEKLVHSLIYSAVHLPRLPPDATLRLQGSDAAKPCSRPAAARASSRAPAAPDVQPLLRDWHSSAYSEPIPGGKKSTFLFSKLTFSLSACDQAAAAPLQC